MVFSHWSDYKTSVSVTYLRLRYLLCRFRLHCLVPLVQHCSMSVIVSTFGATCRFAIRPVRWLSCRVTAPTHVYDLAGLLDIVACITWRSTYRLASLDRSHRRRSVGPPACKAGSQCLCPCPSRPTTSSTRGVSFKDFSYGLLLIDSYSYFI